MEPDPALPRRVAGRYDLGPVIGRGGSGVVRTAWDRREHRALAAKVLHSADAVGLARAAHEQAVRVDHPHLLTPIGWVADDDVVLLLAPLAGGGSLRDQVDAAGAPPPAILAAVLDQLLAGLAALHARGWVHRDVTPANVLLDAGRGPWRARLGDLGIAARIGTPVDAGEAPGTAGYLAPEAVAGAAVDPCLDLYALGVLGLRLLDTAAGGDTGPADGRAAGLGAVLRRLADPDPGRRPVTAEEARALVRDAAVRLDPARSPLVPVRARTPPSPVLVTAASGCFAGAIAASATALALLVR